MEPHDNPPGVLDVPGLVDNLRLLQPIRHGPEVDAKSHEAGCQEYLLDGFPGDDSESCCYEWAVQEFR